MRTARVTLWMADPPGRTRAWSEAMRAFAPGARSRVVVPSLTLDPPLTKHQPRGGGYGFFFWSRLRHLEGRFHGALRPFARRARSTDVLADLVSSRKLGHRETKCSGERLQDALFFDSDGREALGAPSVEGTIQGLDLRRIREIPLVVLKDHR